VGRRERARLDGEGIGRGFGAVWRLLGGIFRALGTRFDPP
jgi:hypothetical protein